MKPADSMKSDDLRLEPRLLSLIVPVYNEASCIEPFLKKISPVLQTVQERFSYSHEIIFVMDPSIDETERVISKAREADPSVKLLVLSRRFGQQPSILAGLFHSCGEAAVVIDVDLQDPPVLILEMMEKHVYENYDVVNAVRTKRSKEPWLRRVVVNVGYYFMNKFSIIEIPRHAGDYRLVDRRVIEELRRLGESHSFFRGLVPFVGFRQTEVRFAREERVSGKTKYPYLLGSITNGVNALICFSNKLLSLSGILGVVFLVASTALLVWIFYLKCFAQAQVHLGMMLLYVLLLFIAGTQALLLAIMGGYIGRIYDEVKQRPIYIVDRKIGF